MISVTDKIKEEELFLPIKRLFPSREYLIKREISFHGKSIDVLLMNRKSHRLIAIELKVNKWKKALRQAAVYQLCASHVYIALWHKHINDKNKKIIANYGIGIIEVRRLQNKSLQSKVLISPKQTALLNKQYAQLLRVNFKERT